MLEHQARDLAKAAGSSVALLLRASPYLSSDALIDALLQLTIRGACFAQAEAPRTRAEFAAAVEQGRERLYPCFEQMSAMLSNWLEAASAVRQALDDSRVRRLAVGAEETRRHLQQLLDFGTINTASLDWLRQLPRYLKAEQRRWQRNAVRGNEGAQIARELEQWSARHLDLEMRLGAEMRWTPKLTELRFWIEEYRVRAGVENSGCRLRSTLNCARRGNRCVARPLNARRSTDRPIHTSKRMPCASAIWPLQLMVLVCRRI